MKIDGVAYFTTEELRCEYEGTRRRKGGTRGLSTLSTCQGVDAALWHAVFPAANQSAVRGQLNVLKSIIHHPSPITPLFTYDLRLARLIRQTLTERTGVLCDDQATTLPLYGHGGRRSHCTSPHPFAAPRASWYPLARRVASDRHRSRAQAENPEPPAVQALGRNTTTHLARQTLG